MIIEERKMERERGRERERERRMILATIAN